MIHGIINICPECRKIIMEKPDAEGTLPAGGLICMDDNYRMKSIMITDILIDQLLKGEVGKDA